MVVNVYLDSKGAILDSLVDEATSHQLGDVIALKGSDTQKVITEIVTSEHYDYGVIVHVNRVADHDNTVDDIASVELKGRVHREEL